MTTRTDLVTTAGPNGPVVLAKRVRALIDSAAKEAGLPSPVAYSQGSYRPVTPYSGTTHHGGGAADVRVWNIPAAKIEPFVVALRKRNAIAWYRTESQGFARHVHLIVADEPDLSTGAKWQVSDWKRGGNGLSGTHAGPDYHPRPVPRSWPWEPPAYPGRIGWGSKGDAVAALQECFGLPQTGVYDKPLRIAIGKWQVLHPRAWGLDRTGPGVVGPRLYSSILSKFWGKA